MSIFRLIFGRQSPENLQHDVRAELVRGSSYLPRGSGRSFKAFENSDTSIKVWLPDRIELLLTELTLTQDSSSNEITRSLLFIHMYGISDFEAMRLQQKGWYKPAKPKSTLTSVNSVAKYSRPSMNRHPELGKSTYALRLWLPKTMRHDLQKMATDRGTPLSQYVREILIRQLLGEGYQPKKGELMAPQDSEDAEKE